jgi:valyl-tRNA synthetase
MNLHKTYDPSSYEKDIYLLWEKSGAFKPSIDKNKEPFSLVMPPPNANANLHMGSALTFGLEDVVVRYKRLRGYSTLFLPGADHAGFETWVVYEKKLAAEGKTRFDFTRDELYRQVWDFVQLNRSNIEEQLRKIGLSCDWDRSVYTLDNKVVMQANNLFKQMWEDKLIYRGERLVNYCTFHGTSFADIEVVYKKERGHLWYINYPLSDGSGHITVATTRPETMLGDTAVAVNPTDKRYTKYIGKSVILPLTKREIPILADDMVDVAYGTGAVKITPAHDQNDYEVAMRHNLPMISVISSDGIMTDDSPFAYRGLKVEEARKQIVNDLEEGGELVKEEAISHSVGHCYKCNTIIQPLLMEQWFVSMKPLAERAIKALENKEIQFYPASKRQQLITYLQGLRDWNISRQIAWGIPIPAFQSVDDPTEWRYDERTDQKTIELEGKTYRRDPDVFDTWFSSGQWPYVTLGYPDDPDFKEFYPLSLMETGGEILYPWVSRMIMLGLYVTGKIPFKEVYIHGYVLAEDGSKMSKSVGNTIDPMLALEEHGSDALRIGVIGGRAAGVNRGYDSRRVREGRNFCNKLWNIARFVEDSVGDNFEFNHNPKPITSADSWILTRVAEISQKVVNDMDNCRFSEALDRIYHLIWDDFADWYIEASKLSLNKDVLAKCLETILKLTHPFAPFVTETIWQTLKWEGDSLLINSAWPSEIKVNKVDSKEFDRVKDLVSEIRYLKGILNISQRLELNYSSSPFVKENHALIKALAKLTEVSEKKESRGLKLTSVSGDVWLQIGDKKPEELIEELRQTMLSEEASIDRLEDRLSNESYVTNAPKQLVDETKLQLKEAQDRLSRIEVQYKLFSKQ